MTSALLRVPVRSARCRDSPRLRNAAFATPTSVRRSAGQPIASAVTMASSATGRSLVPAVTMSTELLATAGGTEGLRNAVRASELISMPAIAPASTSPASGATRVTSTPSPRSAILDAIATTCSGDFPPPKTTSGKPWRSAR